MREATTIYLKWPVVQEDKAAAKNRRRHHRVRVSMPARVRPFGLQAGYFEEVIVTLNLSRGGLQFTTQEKSYYVGMPVRVIVAYSSHDSMQSESAGEVVRVEHHKNGRNDVAIRLEDKTTLGSDGNTLEFVRY